jgi:anti-anti-sigma regulatory factor
MVGMANRPGGYDEEVISYLEPFLATCSGIISAYRYERERQAAEQALRESEAKVRALLQAVPDTMLLVDREGVLLDYKLGQSDGHFPPAESVLGKPLAEALPALSARVSGAANEVISSGITQEMDVDLPGPYGELDYEVSIVQCGGGEALVMLRDVTEKRRAEAERDHIALQERVIAAQTAALAELSTPLIPISEQIVVMPLIGVVDPQRAERVLVTLLQGVQGSRARVAILDITGVPVVDSSVAEALVRAASSVRLLGAEVVLTGIRPDVARSLIELGLDLSTLITRGTLESGIAYAMTLERRRAGRSSAAR